MSTLLESWSAPGSATTGGGSVGAPWVDPDSAYYVNSSAGVQGIDRVNGAGNTFSPLLLPEASAGLLIAMLLPVGANVKATLKYNQPGDATTRAGYYVTFAIGGSIVFGRYAGTTASAVTGTGGNASTSFPSRTASTWCVMALQQVDATHVAIYWDIRDVATPDVVSVNGSTRLSQAMLISDGPVSNSIVGQAGLIAAFTNAPQVLAAKTWSYDGVITSGAGNAAAATLIPSLANLLLPGELALLDSNATTVFFGIDGTATGVQSTGGTPPLNYQMQSSTVSDKAGASASHYANVAGATGKTPSVAVSASGLFLRAKVTDSAPTPQVAYTDEIAAFPGSAGVPITGIGGIGDSYMANGSPPFLTTAQRRIRDYYKGAQCNVVNRGTAVTQTEDWVPGHAGPLSPSAVVCSYDGAIVAILNSIAAGNPIDTVVVYLGTNEASQLVTQAQFKSNLDLILNGYDPAVTGTPTYWQNKANTTIALSSGNSATGYGPFTAASARPGLLSFAWCKRVFLCKPPYNTKPYIESNLLLAYATAIDQLVAANPGKVYAADPDGYARIGSTPLWWDGTGHLVQAGWDALGERVAASVIGALTPSSGGGAVPSIGSSPFLRGGA